MVNTKNNKDITDRAKRLWHEDRCPHCGSPKRALDLDIEGVESYHMEEDAAKCKLDHTNLYLYLCLQCDRQYRYAWGETAEGKEIFLGFYIPTYKVPIEEHADYNWDNFIPWFDVLINEQPTREVKN